MRAFLDANVLFTAVYSPKGLCRGLFRLARTGAVELSSSAFALEEARRNLALKAPDHAKGLDRLRVQLVVVPEPSPALVDKVLATALASKDAPILAAALATRADLLITGDRRHFGHLYGTLVGGTRVVTPSEAFDALQW